MSVFTSQSFKELKDRTGFHLAVIFLAASAVMLPMVIFGIPEGYDVMQHIRFAEAFYNSIGAGDLLPGWAMTDNHGFGSVGIRFYPPLADYLLALTQFVTRDWYDSFLAHSVFWMFPGSFGVYFWAKKHLTPPQSMFAAVLYAVMPYHVLQVYQFTLFSEFAAAAILPFCFLYLTNVIQRSRVSDVILLGVSGSLIILLHLPSTIIAALTLGVYAVFLIDWKQPRRPIFGLVTAAALSLLATSFYLLRVVTEIGWVQHSGSEFTSGLYDYKQYLFPIYVSAPENLYWERLLWLLDASNILTFLCLLPPLVVLFVKRNSLAETASRKLLLALSGTGVFLIFILSSASLFVWESVTPLQKIQFPWRFLSAASLIGAMSFTVGAFMLAERFGKMKRVIGYSFAALVLAIAVFDITENILPSTPNTRERFDEKLAEMRAVPGCRCWWPVWADTRALEQREKVSAGERAVTISDWDRESRKFTIESGTAGTARVATFYYPHWKAEVNGKPAEVGKDEFGAITIPISAERSEIRLYFKEPAMLNIAKAVSGATWIGLIIAIFAGIVRTRKMRIQLANVD